MIIVLNFRIHPRDKQDVAKRLVLSGLAVAYKQSQIVYQGPLPKLFILYIANDTLKIQYNEDTNVLDVRSTDGFDVRMIRSTLYKSSSSFVSVFEVVALSFIKNL